MAGSFSRLPKDIHLGLQPKFGQETLRAADALLGNEDNTQEPFPVMGISELPATAIAAATRDIEEYRLEQEAAASTFVKGILIQEHVQAEIAETKVDQLLTECFDDKYLPRNNGALQTIVDILARRPTTTFSLLMTVWANRLRQDGETDPKLAITWPEGEGLRHPLDFGEGMRDVDLTIGGPFVGKLGTKATNCNFTLDTFKGTLLRSAQDSSATANTIEGQLLDEASRSSITCAEVESNVIVLDDGCKLTAQTAKCPIIGGHSLSPKAPNWQPCEVNIGHLYGEIEPDTGWKVTVDTTSAFSEPPPTIEKTMALME